MISVRVWQFEPRRTFVCYQASAKANCFANILKRSLAILNETVVYVNLVVSKKYNLGRNARFFVVQTVKKEKKYPQKLFITFKFLLKFHLI